MLFEVSYSLSTNVVEYIAEKRLYGLMEVNGYLFAKKG
jgi:hypothetical protein